MRNSEPLRLADELRLARKLFPDVDRALAESGPQDIEEALDARVAELTRRDGALGALGMAGLPGDVRAGLGRAFDCAAQMWPGLDIPTLDEFVERGTLLDTWERALRDDPTLTVVLAPHGLGAAAWKQQFADIPEAPALALSQEVSDEFALLEWPTERSHIPTVPATGARAPDTPTYWTLALVPAATQAPLMGYNHSRGPHPLIGELLTVQLQRLRSGLGPIDTQTFTWIDGRLGEGRLAARHVYDPTEHLIRVSTREWAQQGPHQGARPPIR